MTRENWAALSALFEERFKGKVKIGKGNPKLAAVAGTFAFQAEEKLSFFLARAINLSKRANARQLEKL